MAGRFVGALRGRVLTGPAPVEEKPAESTPVAALHEEHGQVRRSGGGERLPKAAPSRLARSTGALVSKAFQCPAQLAIRPWILVPEPLALVISIGALPSPVLANRPGWSPRWRSHLRILPTHPAGKSLLTEPPDAFRPEAVIVPI
jgi:hypothetical protein